MSGTTSDNTSSPPPSYFCPITLEIMKDPVIDKDGNSFEREAITHWIQEHQASPLTRRPLALSDLAPNRALKDAIDKWLADGNDGNIIHPVASLTPPDYQDSVLLKVSKHLEKKVLVQVEPSESEIRTAIDCVCIIDVSGSMGDIVSIPGGESTPFTILDIVKHAVKTVILSLSPKDRLAVVAFTSDASITFDLSAMNLVGQTLAIQSLETLCPLYGTNIWAGLDKAMTIMESKKQKGRLSSFLLLTDGVPNENPPRGIVPTLKIHKDKGRLPDCINTFGFGYNLDSALLNEIAQVGYGSYSFIPDPGFVGTIFVHSLANLLTTVAVMTQIKLIPLDKTALASQGGTPGLVANISQDGGIVDLGQLQVGQSREFVFDLQDIPDDPDCDFIQVEAEMTLRNGEKHTVIAKAKVETISSNQVEIAETSMARQMLVDAIQGGFTKPLTEATEGVKKAIQTIQEFTHKSNQIEDLLKDANGQVLEALQPEYFAKWGRHYLPSLRYAHQNQQCNNFKDPGVQHYGGNLFKKERDVIDELFTSLPPPKASAYSHQPSSTSSYAAPVNMAAFNNRNGVCFGGSSLVRIADSTLKRVDEIKPDDFLYTIGNKSYRVVYVVESLLNGPIKMSKLNENAIFTPWHPICIEGSWKFPSDLEFQDYYECSKVYNFVLEGGHVIEVGGIQTVTLGHGIQNDLTVSHEFFGTCKVIKALEGLAKSKKGVIQVCGVTRDSQSNLVDGLVGVNQLQSSPNINQSDFIRSKESLSHKFDNNLEMSYREMRVFTEQLKSLGYPQLVSMESFRNPNFDLMSNILNWLISSYDPRFKVPFDVDSESGRVQFIKAIATFLATKAQINVNTRSLYKSDGYAVKELLKITNLLVLAKEAPNKPDSSLGTPPLEMTSKLAKLKLCRSLATEITERGAELYELLGKEMATREIRTRVISQPFDLNDIEKSVKESVESIKEKLKSTLAAYENLQGDESNLVSKIEKKKQEFDRAEKRLKSLQGVRPAYMDEYERIEKDLVGIYQTYMEKFRNLAFLEQQLDEYNRVEQDRHEENEVTLKKMQSRMREEELQMMRDEERSSLATIRPNRPTGAGSKGRLNSGRGAQEDDSGSEEDEEGISLGSDESSDLMGNEDDDLESSELISEGIQNKRPEASKGGQRRPQQTMDDDDDDSLELGDDDEDEDEDDNDF